MSADLHDRIAHLAEARSQRLQDIIDEAIALMERAQFWDDFDDSWQRIRNNPEQWAQMQAERAVTDRAQKDGLDQDEDDW